MNFAKNLKRRRNRSFKLNDIEVMIILVLFHYGQFRNLKYFYLNYVVKHKKNEFPETVSYNRFVELQKKAKQSIQGCSHKRAMYIGMVLWVQIALNQK